MWFLIWNLSALEKMVPILHFPLELDGCLGSGYHLEWACPLWLLPLSFEDLPQQCNGNWSHFSPLYWERSSITHPKISFSQVNLCLQHCPFSQRYGSYLIFTLIPHSKHKVATKRFYSGCMLCCPIPFCISSILGSPIILVCGYFD